MADVALVICIFAAALLFSSIGHGGASGYLAAMALFNVTPESMRPAALSLNVLVASIGTVRFYRAGCFSWPLFWPFAVASVPCAYFGGMISLPTTIYKQVIGAVLLFAAYRLFRSPVSETSRPVAVLVALACGAGIGLLSGLTGVGGGIFLSPLLLIMGWSDTKQNCGVSAAFILVNSIAGIAGLMTKGATLPAELPYWTVAVIAGGLIGSELGAKRLASPTLRKLLAVVLVIAGLKMVFTPGEKKVERKGVEPSTSALRISLEKQLSLWSFVSSHQGGEMLPILLDARQCWPWENRFWTNL
jgi:uncharacterized membrane protein YfcA